MNGKNEKQMGFFLMVFQFMYTLVEYRTVFDEEYPIESFWKKKKEDKIKVVEHFFETKKTW